ncbi:DUF4190 domain-containing protein [Frondihabitans sucicola]|nr:DUF4190 domain-containing protein [Frondihabitans sucicola]
MSDWDDLRNRDQQMYVRYAPRPATNRMAIASLVLGIVGTLLALIPFLGLILCWPPAILAIVFGFIALGTSRVTGLRRVESIVGIVCGFLPIPIFIVGALLLAAFASAQTTGMTG